MFAKRFYGRKKPRQDGSMNRDEAAYALVLECRKRQGEVEWYQFDAINLRLADRTFYKPDFLVMLADGALEIHEVKGGKMVDGKIVPYIEEDAQVKIKVAAAMFPFLFVTAFRHKKQWYFRNY